jgi:class 3 adenylate cyclase
MPFSAQEARQIRAELFQRLIGQLLKVRFSPNKIQQDVLVSARAGGPDQYVRFDFTILERMKLVVVETKISDVDDSRAYMPAVMRRMANQLERVSPEIAIGKLIFAVAGSLSSAPALRSSKIIERAADKRGIEFELWDEPRLRKEIEGTFHRKLSEFSIDSMATFLNAVTGATILSPIATSEPAIAQGDERELKKARAGLHEDAIVLMADFCSYSRFVNASAKDRELIASIMGRFYREARQLVAECGGLLDKFMGDGLLAFWLPPIEISEFERCIKELVGMSIKLAEVWQEQIDIAVSPVGMRCGASLGEVLFVRETPEESSMLHAIGDSINLAARLQGAAKPNTVVFSNRLRQKFFAKVDGVLELPEIDAKNIGNVKAWEKDLAPTQT